MNLLLSRFQALPLLKARASAASLAVSSADLGKSSIEVVLEETGVRFGEDPIVPWTLIESIAKEERRIYSVDNGEMKPVQVFSEATGWMRTLCATESAPTTLISGIPMHRTKGTNPLRDTEEKIKALGPIGGVVLDTATGLGYTAIALAKSKNKVTTLELDPAAIELARSNPWSSELFSLKSIQIIVGDAYEEVAKLPSGAFAGILHDPPTISLGGELYSEEFYRRLRRISRKGGRLFHYVGDPNSAIGAKTYPGVLKRLRAAGFLKPEVREAAFGVVATA